MEPKWIVLDPQLDDCMNRAVCEAEEILAGYKWIDKESRRAFYPAIASLLNSRVACEFEKGICFTRVRDEGSRICGAIGEASLAITETVGLFSRGNKEIARLLYARLARRFSENADIYLSHKMSVKELLAGTKGE